MYSIYFEFDVFLFIWVVHVSGRLSRPKPDTRICDHDRHANIKPKPDINKNQLKLLQNFYRSLPLSLNPYFFT